MDAGFFYKRSIRLGGKARLASFLSVSKPLPVLISLMTAGLKGANDDLHYFIRRCFIHGCCPWSSLLVTRTTVAVSQRSPAARKFVASESIGGYRADMAMSVNPLLP